METRSVWTNERTDERTNAVDGTAREHNAFADKCRVAKA